MIRFIVGLFIVMGAVGRHDFYDECLAASDCVAGDPPSMFVTMLVALFGLALMFWKIVEGFEETA